MAYITNNDKMLESVLMNQDLMRFGDYKASDIMKVEQACDSDNYVINAIARIIKRSSEGATEKEIYKEVTEYLRKNV